MISFLISIEIGLIIIGGIFAFEHPYSRAKSYAKPRFLSGGNNTAVAFVAIGVFVVIVGYFLQ